MANPKFRWGIMGAGGISRTFASDLLHASRAELKAVTSRSKERSEQFAAEFNIPRAYDNYEDFVQDDEIDIVYIGTLHPMHKNGALQCLRAGKHVLCEKPIAMDAEEAAEMIRVARENNVFLMEAMWTRFLPSVVQVRKWLDEGAIGDVHMVTANFGFNIGWDPESRLLNKRLGGGALLDAGIYPISFASMVFGQQPNMIQSSSHIGTLDVDERFSVLFGYEGDRTAMLNSAVRLKLVNEAIIYGTKGHIRVPEFLAAKAAYLHRDDGASLEFKAPRNLHGFIYEIEEVMDCIQEGRNESQIMPLDESLAIMKTLDAVRGQWGLEYPDTIQ